MTSPLVWTDGRLVPAGTATVSALDRGLRSGEGVFETLRVRDGHAFRADRHLARLVATAAALGIHLDVALLAGGLAATVAANRHLGGDVVARLTVTAGALDVSQPFTTVQPAAPTVVITTQPTSHGAAPVSVPASGCVVDLQRELPTWKATSYLLTTVAQRRARDAGATDALLRSPDGLVLEAATANLFAVVDGRLRTAPVSAGVLPGITREAVCELAPEQGVAVHEEALDAAGLRDATEAFLTSAVRGLRPLLSIDAEQVGDGTPGRVTRELADAYERLVTATATPLVSPASPDG